VKNTLRLALRRLLVAVAVVGSLLLGAATIHAAGAWTASQAPLAAPPVTVESLQGRLAAEEARGADLQARLEAVTAQATEVQAALDAAQAQVASDGATARALQVRIAAAKTELTALNRKIAAAARQASPAARTTVQPTTTRPAATPEPDDD
jgi:peptidoglycan hydrolase CwlO-like protein